MSAALHRAIGFAGGLVLLAAGCGSTEGGVTAGPDRDGTATTAPVGTVPATSEQPGAAGAGCADVVGATIEVTGDTYAVSATVASADTGWEKYADAWEVRALDGSVLGTRTLAHPHETEQPFTRSLSGVAIPVGVQTVVIAARDSVEGFCGTTFAVEVPGR